MVSNDSQSEAQFITASVGVAGIPVLNAREVIAVQVQNVSFADRQGILATAKEKIVHVKNGRKRVQKEREGESKSGRERITGRVRRLTIMMKESATRYRQVPGNVRVPLVLILNDKLVVWPQVAALERFVVFDLVVALALGPVVRAQDGGLVDREGLLARKVLLRRRAKTGARFGDRAEERRGSDEGCQIQDLHGV